MKSLMKLGVADIPNDSPSGLSVINVKPLLYYYYNCIINILILSIYIEWIPTPTPTPRQNQNRPEQEQDLPNPNPNRIWIRIWIEYESETEYEPDVIPEKFKDFIKQYFENKRYRNYWYCVA
jgi:hypothetical protein